MKHKKALGGLVSAALVGLAAAKAPDIDPARVDTMVKEILRQADQNPAEKPDGATIRKEVLTQLQTFEVLKNEALKAGLDKDPEVRKQFQTMEAQFYAHQYAQYLERNTDIDERELRRLYDRQTRMIKLQQVSFGSLQEAHAAQALLLKGMSFENLMKRFPNPEQSFNEFIQPQQLPPQIAAAVEPLSRGDVTREPLKLQDRFYLFKLSAVERNPQAQSFELVRNRLAQQAKQQKVKQQIDRLLESNGIRPLQ